MKKMIYAVLLAASLTALTACSSNQGNTAQTTPAGTTAEVNDISLADIHTAVKEAYGENYIPNMEYDEQMLFDVFGIKRETYDNYIAEGPMMSTHVDHFVAVEAKQGQGEAVEKALNEYRDRQVNDSMQYPMNVAKVEASQVVRHGDYVFFVMLGAIDDDAADEEAALTAAKEETKIGVDVIADYFN